MTPRSSSPDRLPVRTHVALDVSDLRASVAFYRAFLDSEPARSEARYARFVVDTPPLLLALNEVDGPVLPPGGPVHYGVQVPSRQAVADATLRLRAAGLATRVEEGVDCCYAVQDKVWVSDPDGRRWEVFTVLEEGISAPGTFPSDAACSSSGGGSACCG